MINKKGKIITLLSVAALATGVYLIIKERNKDMNTTHLRDGYGTVTRGYRNNNPLNIRINNANKWQGKIQPNTDGTFEQFQTMEYGYRAALVLIRNYIFSGVNTLAGIISKWAPANENNTAGYISRVCAATGLLPSSVINANNKDQLCRLVYAMAIVENGNVQGQPVMAQIEQAWNML